MASLPPSAWGGGCGGGGGGGLLEMRPFSGGGMRSGTGSGSGSRLGSPLRPSSSSSSAATRFAGAVGLQLGLQDFRAALAARPGSSCKMREQVPGGNSRATTASVSSLSSPRELGMPQRAPTLD